MKLSLKEQVARVGPIRNVDRTQSGSRGVLVLRPTPGFETHETVSAVLSLARRGVTFAKAKRAVEDAVRSGRAVLLLSSMDTPSILRKELALSGFQAKMVVSNLIDIKVVRERLGLTQEQFALRYGLELDSVQNWESGRRQPDMATRSYLRVIEKLPDQASEALEEVELTA